MRVHWRGVFLERLPNRCGESAHVSKPLVVIHLPVVEADVVLAIEKKAARRREEVRARSLFCQIKEKTFQPDECALFGGDAIERHFSCRGRLFVTA